MSSEATRLKDEGLRLFQDGAYQEALEHFEQAYQAFVETDQPLDAAEMLNNSGVIHRVEGRFAEAAGLLERGL
jgi:tetratricopeptide (TPR) repeat protein